MKSLPIFVALASLVGCVAEVGSIPDPNDPTADDDDTMTEPDDSDMPPPTNEAGLTNNVGTAFHYFVTKGLTETQSAGIIGNLIQESSVSPTAVEFGGGPGRGIAQWSVGGRWDRSAGDNVTSYASQRGVSRWTLTTQLDFIWFELEKFPVYGMASLRAATTLSAAVSAFQNKYEICGACAQSTRLKKAQEVLTTYGGGGGTTGGGTTTGGCYSATLGTQMPENACVQSRSDQQWYQCNAGTWTDRYRDPDACNGEHPL